MGNIDYLGGMDQDRFDFVWVFEGWDALRASQLEGRALGNILFIEHTNCIPDWYTPILITSRQLIEDDPDLVRDFLKATTRGYEHAIANPDEAASLLSRPRPSGRGARAGERAVPRDALQSAEARLGASRSTPPAALRGVSCAKRG